MPAKINTNFSIDKTIRRIQKVFLDKSGRHYIREILLSMKKGISPVKGGRWDKPYSTSYKDQIGAGRYSANRKTTTPVNLKLSGKLWGSIGVKKTKFNLQTIFFKSELADVHNREGTRFGKRIRRMLPTKPDEEFNKGIENKIDLLLRRVVKDNLNK